MLLLVVGRRWHSVTCPSSASVDPSVTTEMSLSGDLAGIEVGSKIVAIDLVRGRITRKNIYKVFFFNESFMKDAQYNIH